MRYRRFILASFAFLFLVYQTHLLHAAVGDEKIPELKITKEEGPVDIEADQLVYERETQIYQAHGNVEVSRGDFFLKSDHAQLNNITKDVTAWGNVLLREGENVVECERLEVNVDTRLGKIYQARLFLKEQNFHITSQETDKLGENHYRIHNGIFTTCDAKRPPWKFTAEEMDVTLAGQGMARGSTVYIEDIPLLYLPVASFPVAQDRQTGFLIPVVDYSSTHGFESRNAFFWAMTKDMDATVRFDTWGDRGYKEALEYRYAFTNETRGQANFYFIDDQVYGGNRYAFFLQHQQKLPYDFYLKGDINQISDKLYPQDFSRDLPMNTAIDAWSLMQMRSNLYGGKNWDQFSFLVDGTVFRDLTQESNDQTVQRLPQVSFYANPQSLFKTPFFYDLTSSYTNFWREKGVEAYRGDFFPRFSYPTRLFNVLKFDSNIGFRETFYRSFNDPTGQFQGWKSRETLEAEAEVAAEFYRVYGGETISKISKLFGVDRWMHTIEPTIGYSYSPRVNQDDLPQFDPVDRIPFTNQITYGVTQRFVGKPTKEGVDSGPYEYAKLKIFQSYSFGDPFEKGANGKGRYLSDIQSELWWNFNPFIIARADTEFNPYRGNFDHLNGLLRMKDQRNDAVQVQYRYTKDNIQEVNLYTRLKTIPPLYLYGGIYYNVLDSALVETIYGVEYSTQCWEVGLLVEDRYPSPNGTQKREVKFQVYLNILGLTSAGHKPAFMKL